MHPVTYTTYDNLLVLHSHALAVSAFCTRLSCHPTLILVSLNIGFTVSTLAPVSITLVSIESFLHRIVRVLLA
jgi:hypothetical protein